MRATSTCKPLYSQHSPFTYMGQVLFTTSLPQKGSVWSFAGGIYHGRAAIQGGCTGCNMDHAGPCQPQHVILRSILWRSQPPHPLCYSQPLQRLNTLPYRCSMTQSYIQTHLASHPWVNQHCSFHSLASTVASVALWGTTIIRSVVCCHFKRVGHRCFCMRECRGVGDHPVQMGAAAVSSGVSGAREASGLRHIPCRRHDPLLGGLCCRRRLCCALLPGRHPCRHEPIVPPSLCTHSQRRASLHVDCQLRPLKHVASA